MDDDRPDDASPSGLRWETLDSHVAYSCEGFDVVNERVRLPDGTAAEYDHVSEPPSVVVLPFVAPEVADDDAAPLSWPGAAGPADATEETTSDGRSSVGSADAESRRVVLVEEWRQAVRRVNRGLPAGSTEPGEDPLVAARRELQEETGYSAESVEHLVSVEPSNGVGNQLFHYVVARGCRPDAGRDLDDDESIRATTGSLAGLYEAVAQGRVRDGRTVTGLLYYRLHG